MSRRHALAVTGLGVGVALALAACTAPEPRPFRPPAVGSDVPDLEAGRFLYERDCAWCHGAAGEGTSFGPDLDGPLDGGAYTHFVLASGRMPLAEPDDESRRGPPRYDDDEIAAIVAHVETFGGTGPGIPAIDPAAGDLARGGELYLELCAACHSSTGAGGALTSGEVAPALQHVSPLVVAEAVLVGPGCPNASPTCGPGEGAMPRFELDPHELNALVRYVDYLQDPADTGGAPIGRIGPVAEGAIALLLGLGSALLLSRWIGTRARRRG